MATYYFHLRNGTDVLLDPEGRQLESTNVAGAALSEARSIMAADCRSGEVDLNQNIEVEDSAGKLVHRISFADAVSITRLHAG
jgi:hypothetical protein